MPTRRLTLLGGAISVMSGFSCPCHSKENLSGCSISIQAARRYLTGDSSTSSPLGSVVTRSGNSDFDFAAAQTLSKLTDLFGVLPGFLYFKEDSKNAFATNGRLMNATDGTILFGRDLLFDILAAAEGPDAIFSGICAHEFAHILQFKKGLDLNKGQATAKRGELHADFLAGYFAGVRKSERPSFPAAVIAVAHGNFGDFDFNHPQHHGTPAERSEAVVQGFQFASSRRTTAEEAFHIGVNYVMNLR